MNKILTNLFTVTLFQNIKFSNTVIQCDIVNILEMIRNGSYQDLVERIRRETDVEDQKELKTQLPAITVSCQCNSRSSQKSFKEKFIKATGLIQIDIDLEEIKQNNLTYDTIKDMLIKDKHILTVFKSPRCGLKAFIRINKYANSDQEHKDNFKFVSDYIYNQYNLKIDQVVSSIFATCFLSYDPEIYINYEAEELEIVLEDNTLKPIKYKSNIEDKPTKETIQAVIETLKECNGICNEYQVFFQLLCAFKWCECKYDEIDCIFQNSEGYNYTSNVKLYDTLNPKGDITFGTAYYLAKQYNPVLLKDNLEKYKTKESSIIFWDISDKGIVSFDPSKLREFLSLNGFKYIYINTQDKLNKILIKEQNKIMELTNFESIIKFTSDYIREQDISNVVFNSFVSKKKLIDTVFLSTLPTLQVKLHRDTKDKSYVYFLNGFVEVTKNSITLKSYKELNGYIWVGEIKQYNYNPVVDKEALLKFNFIKFLTNVCSNPETKEFNKDRYYNVIIAIGRILHRYKDLSNTNAIAITEINTEDTGTSHGGTGKGLILQSIGKLRNVVSLNGRAYDPNNKFMFQNVEVDTDIVVMDDVNKRFDFENLFHHITEGLVLEKKNQKSYIFTIEDSPTLVILSNYAISTNSTSAKRRLFEVEIDRYYNDIRTPKSEFNEIFFTDWKDNDWNLFFEFMLNCLQLYLKDEIVKIKIDNTNLIKKAITETNEDFYNMMKEIELNKFYTYTELYQMYCEQANLTDKDKKVNPQTFGRWINSYVSYMNLKVEKLRLTNDPVTNRRLDTTTYYYIFTNKE